MALDIAKGMNQLHSYNPPIVHRDLKSPNLLVSLDWKIKIADFGLSRTMQGSFLSTQGVIGTCQWMSPEVLMGGHNVTEKSDVFSFGVILYEIVTRQKPWSHFQMPQQIAVQIFKGHRLEMPDGVQPEILSLVKDCWQEDPTVRPSFTSILERLTLLKSITPPESLSSVVEEASRKSSIPLTTRPSPPLAPTSPVKETAVLQAVVTGSSGLGSRNVTASKPDTNPFVLADDAPSRSVQSKPDTNPFIMQ